MAEWFPSIKWGRVGSVAAIALTLVVGVALPVAAQGGGNGHYGQGAHFGGFAGQGYVTHHGSDGESDVNVCSDVTLSGQAACGARVVTQTSANASSASAPNVQSTSSCTTGDLNAPGAVIAGGNGGYDPCYLQSAYNVAASAEANGGSGQIIAIVDYTVDPTIAADLANYRSQFGLPACPSGNVSHSNTSCVFQQVAQSGAPTSGSTGWDVEISLDVDAVSAICPNCQILLLEANSASLAALGGAVNTAVADGANAVSNSYGASEFSSEASYASTYYQHPGVAIVASSGDGAGVVDFPAVSPDVTSVGGTALLQYSNQGTRSANATETVWNGTPSPGDGAGAGCSRYVARPSWQASFLSAAGAPAVCTTRVTADVSADADPDTGLWVYDSQSDAGGWLIVGGTSLASPTIAAIYGLAGNATGSSVFPVATAYANSANLYHVTKGNVGSCANYLCDATKSVGGYNGPSGLGTPGGTGALAAFTYNSSAPPPPPVAPGPPTGLSASPGNGSVSLTWTAPSSNGGAAISGYLVFEASTSGAENPLTATPVATPSGTSATVTGLTNGSTYYFEVEAANTAGDSVVSNEAHATPANVTVPGAPSVTSASAGSGSVTLGFSAPANNGGESLTGYRVYEGTTSPPTTELSGTVAVTASTVTVTGLSNGTTYYFAMVAVNGVGPSGLSNVVSSTPGLPGAPTNLRARASGTSVALTWRAPFSAGGGSLKIQGYKVLVSTSSSMSSPTTYTTSGTATGYTVSGLITSTTYYFEVYSINSAGTQSSSPAGPVSSRG